MGDRRAIAFSALVETLSLLTARARKRRLWLTASGEIVEEKS
jgi:hypothetical protein